MRAILALRALIVISTLVVVGCGPAGPVSPESATHAADDTGHRLKTADDPCNPNSNPC